MPNFRQAILGVDKAHGLFGAYSRNSDSAPPTCRQQEIDRVLPSSQYPAQSADQNLGVVTRDDLAKAVGVADGADQINVRPLRVSFP